MTRDKKDDLPADAGREEAPSVFAALSRESDVWRTTLASIGDAVITTDPIGRITFMNPVATELTGWSAADAVGKDLHDVFHIVNESTRAPVQNPALKALSTGTIVGLANHTVLIRRDGEERAIDDSAAPIRGETGTVEGSVLVFRDIAERRQSEIAKSRLAAIIESSDDAIVGKSLDGIVQSWNRGAERLFGYNADEAIGKSITMVIPPERLGEEDDILSRIRRGETIDHFETVRVRKDGRLVDVTVSISPIRNAHGEVVGASKIARDISALKATQRVLSETRRRSEAALQAGEVGTYYWDILRDRVSGDPNFVAMFGVPSDPRETAPVADFLAAVHEADRDRVAREIRQTLDRDMPFHSEYRIQNGAIRRWVLARGTVERNDRGEPVGWVGVIVDLTRQHEAEERLAEQETQFRTLFTEMNEGYCVIEMIFDDGGKPIDFRYVLVNNAYEHHTGMRDVVGKTVRELLPGFEPHFIEAYGQIATTGEPRQFVEHVADLGRWFEVSGFRVGDPKKFQVAVLFSDVSARKHAEENLRVSEQRLAEVFQHAPSFMVVLRGPNHVFELVNDRYRELVSGRRLEGLSVREALPEIVEQGFIELLDQVFRTGQPFVGVGTKVILRTPGTEDEDVRYLDFVYQPLRDENGAVSGIIIQGIDQTDRVRAEAAAREKDARFELLLGNATDYAVVITDAEGSVQDWLGGAQAITGYTPEEIIGQPAATFFTPGDRAAGVPEHEFSIAATEGRAEDKRWHQKKDGGQFFGDGVTVALKAEDGSLRGFGKVFRDATPRKRTEDAMEFLASASASLAELVDYESTLRRIANIAVEGFADWCVVDVLNEAGERQRLAVTTSEPADVTAARIADSSFLLDDGTAGIVPHVLRTGEPEAVTDLAAIEPGTAAQGAERIGCLLELGICSYLCVPLVSRGRVIGGITFLSSTPRRRFGDQELRVAQSLAERVTVSIENAQLYRALQDQDRRKDEFLATLAHELRNPLAPVRNGIQILRMGKPADAIAERALDMMDRQLGHMAHLVEDLMDLSRVSSGKVVLRKELLPLPTILEAAVETSRQAIEAGGHHLELKFPSEPLFLDADRTRLVQVVANLLNNAAKYTPQGGHIVLSADRERDDAVIRVTDSGLGIPSAMLPRVFDMFTQVGTSLERSQGGLGIGLTLVKRLVEMHGGIVAAASPGAGKGSTFTIRLPLAPEAVRASGVPQEDEHAKASGRRLSILVVDDNRDSADSLAMLLDLMGHEVQAVHDGPEALRRLGNVRPDLIFLDLGLPGMSGYEVARRVRESSAFEGIRLAALTGWGQEEDRRRTRTAGFDYHVVKPAQPDEIERILRETQDQAR